MIRKDIIDVLFNNPMTVPQLARVLREPPKDVETDLKHLLKSVKHTEYVADVETAECRKCGFEFSTDKLHKPSKCPECRSTWINEPRIAFKEKTAQLPKHKKQRNSGHMKAIQVQEFGGPEVLQLAELPIPEPAKGQVLVRIHAAGVNPVETYIRSGAYAALPKLPYTPGKDAAGTVEKIGADVKDWKVGDRVFTSNTITGAYAQYAVCDAADVHALPDKSSFDQGAAINTPYATAYRALFQRARALPGETVLVHGASGGVGSAALQLANAAGMIVVGTAGSEAGRAMAADNGARHVFDHHTPDYLTQALAATNGRGFDVILEMLANVNLGRDLTVLAQGGRVVVIGSRGKVEINPRDAMLRDASIMGMILSNASPEERAQIYAGIGAGLAQGTLNPIVGKEFPISDAPHAHEAVLESGAFGKVVLIP